MFDIKSGVLALALITFLVVDRFQHNATLNDLKHLKTKVELMKEFHSNSQETLQLETSNRKSESKIHLNMINQLFETIGQASQADTNTQNIKSNTKDIKSNTKDVESNSKDILSLKTKIEGLKEFQADNAVSISTLMAFHEKNSKYIKEYKNELSTIKSSIKDLHDNIESAIHQNSLKMQGDINVIKTSIHTLDNKFLKLDKVQNANVHRGILADINTIKSNIGTIDNNFAQVEKVIQTLKTQESKDENLDEALRTKQTSDDSKVSTNYAKIIGLEKSENKNHGSQGQINKNLKFKLQKLEKMENNKMTKFEQKIQLQTDEQKHRQSHFVAKENKKLRKIDAKIEHKKVEQEENKKLNRIADKIENQNVKQQHKQDHFEVNENNKLNQIADDIKNKNVQLPSKQDNGDSTSISKIEDENKKYENKQDLFDRKESLKMDQVEKRIYQLHTNQVNFDNQENTIEHQNIQLENKEKKDKIYMINLQTNDDKFETDMSNIKTDVDQFETDFDKKKVEIIKDKTDMGNIQIDIYNLESDVDQNKQFVQLFINRCLLQNVAGYQCYDNIFNNRN